MVAQKMFLPTKRIVVDQYAPPRTSLGRFVHVPVVPRGYCRETGVNGSNILKKAKKCGSHLVPEQYKGGDIIGS